MNLPSFPSQQMLESLKTLEKQWTRVQKQCSQRHALKTSSSKNINHQFYQTVHTKSSINNQLPKSAQRENIKQIEKKFKKENAIVNKKNSKNSKITIKFSQNQNNETNSIKLKRIHLFPSYKHIPKPNNQDKGFTYANQRQTFDNVDRPLGYLQPTYGHQHQYISCGALPNFQQDNNIFFNLVPCKQFKQKNYTNYDTETNNKINNLRPQKKSLSIEKCSINKNFPFTARHEDKQSIKKGSFRKLKSPNSFEKQKKPKKKQVKYKICNVQTTSNYYSDKRPKIPYNSDKKRISYRNLTFNAREKQTKPREKSQIQNYGQVNKSKQDFNEIIRLNHIFQNDNRKTLKKSHYLQIEEIIIKSISKK